jgi:hypothetical protein
MPNIELILSCLMKNIQGSSQVLAPSVMKAGYCMACWHVRPNYHLWGKSLRFSAITRYFPRIVLTQVLQYLARLW